MPLSMKPHHVLRAAASVVVLGVYFATLSPSIAGGDSGELIAEGCILGTSHPPGYPLLTILVFLLKNINFLPGASVISRVNASSSIFSVIAATYISAIVVNIKKLLNLDHCVDDIKGGGHLLALGLFSFSPLVWQYAVTTEVFPMNTMFSAVIIFLCTKFAIEKKESIAVTGAFICGLAICNQHTIVLFEIPCILWMLFLLRTNILHDSAVLIRLVRAFLIGLLPYIYLPLAATVSPNGGGWGDVKTFSGFINHFIRKDYGTFQLFSGANNGYSEGLSERNDAYWKDITEVQGLCIIPYLAVISFLYILVFSFTAHQNMKTHRSDSVQEAIIALLKTEDLNTNEKNKAKITKKSTDSKGKFSDSEINEECSQDSFQNRVCDIESRYTPLIIILTFIFYFAVFHSLSNIRLSNKLLYGVHQRFWMQPNVLIFVFGGVGYDLLLTSLCIIIGHIIEFAMRNNMHENIVVDSMFLVETDQSVSKKIQNKNKTKKNKQPNIITTANENTNTAGKYKKIVKRCLPIGGHIFGALLIIYQMRKHYYVSDQSESIYFPSYAKAILDGLPKDATILLNYDMQWTSIRYLQQCEKYRTDITSINLALMSYDWFQHKQKHYPNLNFPGLLYNPFLDELGQKNLQKIESTKKSSGIKLPFYNLYDFLQSNPRKDIYITGIVNSAETSFFSTYAFEPVGLASKIILKNETSNARTYGDNLVRDWKRILGGIGGIDALLPLRDKYSERTWEWTIGRDLKDRVAGRIRFVLILIYYHHNIGFL